MLELESPGRSLRSTLQLDVHGLRIAVRSDWDQVVEQLALDFAWFESEGASGAPSVEIEIERRPPDFDRFGDLVATFVTPRNVVYADEGLTIVDYFGRAVSVLDRERGRLLLQGEDLHLVHEAAYLYVLSRAGEHLDGVGLLRLHGLGLAGRDGAVAVLLPSGGGKSTLALRALRADGVRLLSEDSPLADRRGRLHPFPLRLGINTTDAADLPEGRVRTLERMEFHPKVVLDVAAFRDRIEPDPQPVRHVVIGRRSLGTGARLEPVPRRAAVSTLLREAVVGVGIYQGMEFVLQRGMRDVLRQGGTAWNRAACCAALLSRARVWRFTLGRDHDANWATLAGLLK